MINFTQSEEDKMRAIVTVVGIDKVGIIAGVCNTLADHKINVLDIKQTIIDDFFNMIMIVDLSDADFKSISEALNELGIKLGVTIQIQHESIFTSMHRI